MPDPSFETRLSVLRDFDVAELLSHVISHTRQIEADNGDFAEYLLSTWETALSGRIDALAASVRAVRGYDGYRLALSRFRRAHLWRQQALEQLHLAIRTRSRRAIDRWSWTAAAYRVQVEGFLRERDVILAADRAKPVVEQEVQAAGVQNLRVLREVAGLHSDTLRILGDHRSHLYVHCLQRLRSIASEATASRRRLEELLEERQRWKARVNGLPERILSPAAVARLPSVAAQIDAYKAALRAAEHEGAIEAAAVEVHALNDRLAELAPFLRDRRTSKL